MEYTGRQSRSRHSCRQVIGIRRTSARAPTCEEQPALRVKRRATTHPHASKEHRQTMEGQIATADSASFRNGNKPDGFSAAMNKGLRLRITTSSLGESDRLPNRWIRGDLGMSLARIKEYDAFRIVKVDRVSGNDFRETAALRPLTDSSPHRIHPVP